LRKNLDLTRFTSFFAQRLKSDFYLCFLAENQLLGMSKKLLDPPPSQPALDWLLLNFLAF
jgi:hypothetical protein